MRILGWILTIMGYLWAYSGGVRLVTTAMNGGPGAGTMIIISLCTLVIAALSLWGGSKLRDKADAAQAQKSGNR